MILNSPFISGSLTVTGNTIISGSITAPQGIAGTASYASNAELLDGLDSTSFTQTSSFNAASSSLAARLVSNEAKTGSFATTGSNAFSGDQIVTGSLTTTGTIVAQTLVVQTVTSSVVYSSGSNIFGLNSGNNHQFTGSVLVSGSLNINSSSLYVGPNGQIGVNTISPQSQFVVGKSTNSASVEINLNNNGYGRIFAYDRTATAAANLILNDPGGNVGIGVTNPLAKLSVSNGGADTLEFAPAVSSANNRILSYNRTTSTYSGLTLDGETLFFKTSDSERMRISNGGNVGIGTTSPGRRLSIESTDIWMSIKVTGNKEYLIGSGTTDALRFYDASADAERMRITSGGNVLIGTSTLGASTGVSDLLTIGKSGSTSTGVNFTDGSSTRWGFIYINNAKTVLGSFTDAAFETGTSATERMRITSGGNVLIGTTTDNSAGLLQVGSSSNTKISLTGGSSQNGMRWESVAGANAVYLFNGNFGPGPGWGLYNISSAALPFWILNSGAATFSSSVSANAIFSNTDFRTDGGTVKVGAGSNNYYTQMSTAYIFPYIDSYFDSVAGASYEGRIIFRTSSEGGALGIRMTILNNGNVGIGSTAPTSRLSVHAAAGAGALRIEGVAGQNAISVGGAGAVRIDYPGVSGGRFEINDNATMFLRQYANGTLSISSGQVLSSSDKNLKIVDGEINNALDKISNLTPKYFYWKEDSGIDSSERQLGFFAQDVKEALGEEVANNNSGGKWGIYDRGILAMLTKAIQELSAKNDALEARLAALETA